MSLRLNLWNKLMKEWNICDKLPAIAHEIGLEDLKNTYIDAILSGKTKGRIVVKLKEDCCIGKTKIEVPNIELEKTFYSNKAEPYTFFG
jgi:hypothetical protein